MNNKTVVTGLKLLFLAAWGLALGACMNDANATMAFAATLPL